LDQARSLQNLATPYQGIAGRFREEFELDTQFSADFIEERIGTSSLNRGIGARRTGTEMITRTLFDFYRCPEDLVQFSLASKMSGDCGFFKFSQKIVCYGRDAYGRARNDVNDNLCDVASDVVLNGDCAQLPFDPTEVVDNLRMERYWGNGQASTLPLALDKSLHWSYYLVRKLLTVGVRKHLQKAYLRNRLNRIFPHWPIDCTVEHLHRELLGLSLKTSGQHKVPFIWFWPDGASSCLALTHDVETEAGRNFCGDLMKINEQFGFRSAFQIIPEERYTIPSGFCNDFRNRGFEINVHDLNHDGRLYRNHEEFLRRARKINHYAREFGATGFRSGAMYRNPEWYSAFEFSYDMSVPNAAHLEPQFGGCCTVMPYFIGKLLELPLTMTQDYSLFHVMDDYSLELWKGQIDTILAENGLIMFITHPDYLKESRARQTYLKLLELLRLKCSEANIWAALPCHVDQWWRQRNEMYLVREGDKWTIEGKGQERARLAYAELHGDSVVYRLSPEQHDPSAFSA